MVDIDENLEKYCSVNYYKLSSSIFQERVAKGLRDLIGRVYLLDKDVNIKDERDTQFREVEITTYETVTCKKIGGGGELIYHSTHEDEMDYDGVCQSYGNARIEIQGSDEKLKEIYDGLKSECKIGLAK